MPSPNQFANTYSRDEDRLIIRLKETKNCSWAKIATRFPGRTAGALQARYSRKLSRRSEGPNASVKGATSWPSSAATTTSDDVNDATTSAADSLEPVSDDNKLRMSDEHDTGIDDDDVVHYFRGIIKESTAAIGIAVNPGYFGMSDPIPPTDFDIINQDNVLPLSTTKITLPEGINLNNILSDATNSGRRSMRHHHSVSKSTLNLTTHQRPLPSLDHFSDIEIDISEKNLQVTVCRSKTHHGPSSRSHKAKVRLRLEGKMTDKPSHETTPKENPNKDRLTVPSRAKKARPNPLASHTDVEIWQRASDGSVNFNKPNRSCPLNLKLNHVRIVKLPLVQVDKSAPRPVPQKFNRHTILAGFTNLPDDADVRFRAAPPQPPGTVREGRRMFSPPHHPFLSCGNISGH